MHLKILQALFSYFVVCIVAYDDFVHVYGQATQEMVEQGKLQYQRLQERGSLPRYGSCWKSALDHVEEGCRDLSEDSQSDMALHLTNCFLEQSGHQIYNCETDKKPNLRRICIASMTDRAFGVYTEFYTHTQNICWFLRGQVWHETIIENTLRVGKQLEISAKNQDDIIKGQKESLRLQENLIQYGKNLQKITALTSKSLENLQYWLVNELSWFDLIVFYVSSSVLAVIFTSSIRTASARLPILFLLTLNAVFERFIYNGMSLTVESDINLTQNDIYTYIWWSRRFFVFFSVSILMYKIFTFEDLSKVNNILLHKIYDQNVEISENLERMNTKDRFSSPSIKEVSFIRETNSFVENSNKVEQNGSFTNKINNYVDRMKQMETYKTDETVKYNKVKDINICKNDLNGISTTTNLDNIKYNNRLVHGRESLPRFTNGLQLNGRYNLRSRQGTPDSNI